MSKELLQEFGAALREFAQQEDLDPKTNKPVYDFRERGLARFNFRRGNFAVNTGNRVLAALATRENGITDPLMKIAQELQAVGVILELDPKEIGDTGETLIKGIILVCRGDALQLCGLE